MAYCEVVAISLLIGIYLLIRKSVIYIWLILVMLFPTFAHSLVLPAWKWCCIAVGWYIAVDPRTEITLG